MSVGLVDMPISRFVWTDHALERIAERGLTRVEVENAVAEAHETRLDNVGSADWLLRAKTDSGLEIEAIYDHPHHGDVATARIISVWRVRQR